MRMLLSSYLIDLEITLHTRAQRKSGETPLHRCLFNNYDEPAPTEEYLAARWRTAKQIAAATLTTHGSGSSSGKATAAAAAAAAALSTAAATTTTASGARRGIVASSHRSRQMSGLLRFGADVRILTNTDESVRPVCVRVVGVCS